MSGETVIEGSRGGLPVLAVIGLAGGLLLAAKLGSTDVAAGLPLAVRAGSVLFFGALGLLGWFKPTRIRLGREGFSVEPALGRAKRVAWSDIDEPRVWVVSGRPGLPGIGRQWVAWSWRAGAAGRSLSLKTTDGVIGAVPGAWRTPASEIAALMHERLEASRA